MEDKLYKKTRISDETFIGYFSPELMLQYRFQSWKVEKYIIPVIFQYDKFLPHSLLSPESLKLLPRSCI